MVQTIYAVGNPDIKEDSLAIEMAQELKIPDFEFKILNHPEILLNMSGALWIMDVVKGIKSVQIIDDISKLKERKITSLHDFDLGMLLKIMKEADSLDEIKIIAIPIGMGKETAKKEITKLLTSLPN